ncbi:MAG: hypothetical protein IIC20_07155, partial [Chloroflexi bacterium]|nr:hypothetical protein [Chloroflexota bacterium]
MTETTIISADDHMDLNELPADLWQKRLPAKFRDAAPKVVVDPKRGPVWEGDGARWGPHGPGRPGSMPGLFEKAGIEGDFGEIFPRLDPLDSEQLDIGFSVGRMPLLAQQGLFINEDKID